MNTGWVSAGSVLPFALVAAGGPLMVPSAATASPGLTVVVVNNNPRYTSEQVFVMAQAGGTSVVADPQPLSARDSFSVEALNSGRVFVSLGQPLPAVGEPSPDTSQVRYDTVELTYPGVANLTAVDMFGVPLDIEVFDAHGDLVGAKRWDCYTDVVQDRLATSLTAAGGDFGRTRRTDSDGRFLRLVSPNIVSGLHPSGYPRFDSYVDSLIGVPLTIRGAALGSSYEFVGEFRPDPDDPDRAGTLTLADRGPDRLEPIEVTAGSLVGNSGNDTNGIYGNNSPYRVGGRPHSGNDVYSAAYRDLVAGFAYGFWGSPAYGNDSARFDVAAAPGPFAAAQPQAPNYNVWAAALWSLTDAYGFPYGDTFNDEPDRNPIVPLPRDGTLRITVQPDTSPPACSAGGGAPSGPDSPPPESSVSPAPHGTPPSDATAPSPPPSQRVSRPGRPGQPRVVRWGRRSVTLSWSPPLSGGAPSQYTVQARAGARCRTLARATRPTLRTTIARIWRGRAVDFRVRASNSAGTGAASRVRRVSFPWGHESPGPAATRRCGVPDR